MDYKELLQRLFEHSQSLAAYNDQSLSYALEDAIAAINTLVAERDELMQAQRGNCKVCKNSPPPYAIRIGGKVVAQGPCANCKYSTHIMFPPLNNIPQDKDNWQWRGLQKPLDTATEK